MILASLRRASLSRHGSGVLLGCLLSVACSGLSEQEDYVGFGDEASMVDRFPSLPKLPVRQERFESELARLPVHWERHSFAADSPAARACPDPRSLDRDTRTELAGCLVVRDESPGQKARRYIAFIDSEARVVLVENVFETLPPG